MNTAGHPSGLSVSIDGRRSIRWRPVGGALCSASLTKVGHLEFSQVADEQVLRLQVSVEDPPAVDVTESPQQLEHEDLETATTNNNNNRVNKTTTTAEHKDLYMLIH